MEKREPKDLTNYDKRFEEDPSSFNDFQANDYIRLLKKNENNDEAIEVGKTFMSLAPNLKGYLNQYGYALYNKYINIDDEKIKEKLSDLLQTMAGLTGESLAKRDKEFHDTLVFATKNNLLITIMQAVSIVYTECVEYDSKDCLLASHTRIYEALIKGDEKDFNDAIDFHYDLIEKRA